MIAFKAFPLTTVQTTPELPPESLTGEHTLSSWPYVGPCDLF